MGRKRQLCVFHPETCCTILQLLLKSVSRAKRRRRQSRTWTEEPQICAPPAIITELLASSRKVINLTRLVFWGCCTLKSEISHSAHWWLVRLHTKALWMLLIVYLRLARLPLAPETVTQAGDAPLYLETSPLFCHTALIQETWGRSHTGRCSESNRGWTSKTDLGT